MQLKSSLISFNHYFDSPVIPTKRKEADNRKVRASLFLMYSEELLIATGGKNEKTEIILETTYNKIAEYVK